MHGLLMQNTTNDYWSASKLAEKKNFNSSYTKNDVIIS